MENGREICLWCVAKHAAVRKDSDGDSPVLDRIGFMEMVKSAENPEVVDGRINVSYRVPTVRNKKKPILRGWVPMAALTATKVEDYAGLYFTALKDTPVYNRFHGEKNHGKQIGVVPVGMKVKMIAVVGDWCLTSRGWGLTKDFRKNREIIDSPGFWNDLLGAYLKQAVNDFDTCYNRLKLGRYNGEEDFVVLAARLEEVERFFKYVYMEDHYRQLLKERAADEVFLRNTMRRLRYLRSKGRVYFRSGHI